MLQLHGSSFVAGGDVTLSLDGGTLALSSNISKRVDSPHNRGLLILLAQLTQNGTILVDSSGNFDATIHISASLPLGIHTIHASETVIGVGVRNADLNFNIVQQLTTIVPTETPTPTPSPAPVQTATPIPGPIVSRITPTYGPTNGGTTVTITGSGFTGATSVSFSSITTSNINVDSDTQITAVTTFQGAKTVDVTVTTAGGTSVTSSKDQLSYYIIG